MVCTGMIRPRVRVEIAKKRVTRGFADEESVSFDIEPCLSLEEIRNS